MAGTGRLAAVVYYAKTLADGQIELPPFNLSHLNRMTDDVGILQHAIGTVPNYSEGYTTDDNARGLIFAVMMEELGKENLRQINGLASRCLAFLWHAFNNKNGHFRNFMGYDRRWLEEKGSPDSHARALWGLATVLGRSRQEGLRRAAARLFERTLPPRASLTIFGRCRSLSSRCIHICVIFPATERRKRYAPRWPSVYYDAYQKTASPDWNWFDNQLTYANASLPHALLLSGQGMQQKAMEAAGLEALEWLMSVQTSGEGHFIPIGNEGFYHSRRKPRPLRSAADRGPCHDFGMHRRLPPHRPSVVEAGGLAHFRMVPGPQRRRRGAIRSADGRLLRRTVDRRSQRQSRGGIDAGFPALAGRTAVVGIHHSRRPRANTPTVESRTRAKSRKPQSSCPKYHHESATRARYPFQAASGPIPC